jgi:hypothetical protein
VLRTAFEISITLSAIDDVVLNRKYMLCLRGVFNGAENFSHFASQSDTPDLEYPLQFRANHAKDQAEAYPRRDVLSGIRPKR